MRGSGIYAEDWTGTFYCSDCDNEHELDGQTDDWGHNAYAECPDCGKGLEVELPSREEMEADYWADYDPEK
jgi:transcription elongation factor Elf1